MLKIIKLVGLYDSNVYILEKDNECLIIDAGLSLEKVKEVVRDKKVVGVLLTHGHFDHSFFANDYAKYFGCKILAHENSKLTMSDKTAFCGDNGQVINEFSAFDFFKGEWGKSLGEFKVKCFYFPGHCHCECGYLIEDNLFAGDFLFEKSFGRIDLKFSSKEDMIKSLSRVREIEFETLYSGHGNSSKKEAQLSNINLFLRFLTRNC